MPNRGWKKPNALKHGVFSVLPVIPGEDEREFQRLLNDVVEEWQPAGATEQEAVLCIAKAMWLKRRATEFLGIQLVKNTFDRNHPTFDEEFGLKGFVSLMQLQPETAFDEYATRCLRPDKIHYLRQKFPLGDFESTSEWAQAIVNEITSVLLPKATMDDTPEVVQKYMLLVRSAATFSGDLFDRELTLDERLNAMIDRAIKRLIHIKAMKQMFGAVHKQRQDEKLRKLPVRKESNVAVKVATFANEPASVGRR